MSKTFMDQLNETPVTYAVLLIYMTMAYLTRGFVFMPEIDPLVDYGAAVGLLVHDGEPWRIVSHAFLHGGLIHLALNSYALLILGPTLERYLGTWRFITLYLVSAIGGCLCALLVTDEARPLIGGSGALFGMLGAALALNIRGGRTVLDFLENQGARQLIMIIVFNLLIGFFIPFVSNGAHVGGLIAGFVLVFCFLDLGRRSRIDQTGRVIQVAWVLAFLSLTLYAVNPVLRFDYVFKHYVTEDDPDRKKQLRRYLDEYDGMPALHRMAWLQYEEDPKVGIGGVARREYEYANTGAARRIVRTWRRWKNRD